MEFMDLFAEMDLALQQKVTCGATCALEEGLLAGAAAACSADAAATPPSAFAAGWASAAAAVEGGAMSASPSGGLGVGWAAAAVSASAAAGGGAAGAAAAVGASGAAAEEGGGGGGAAGAAAASGAALWGAGAEGGGGAGGAGGGDVEASLDSARSVACASVVSLAEASAAPRCACCSARSTSLCTLNVQRGVVCWRRRECEGTARQGRVRLPSCTSRAGGQAPTEHASLRAAKTPGQMHAGHT